MWARTYICVAPRSHTSEPHGLGISFLLAAGGKSMGPINTLNLVTAMTLECQLTTCTDIRYTHVRSFILYVYMEYGKGHEILIACIYKEMQVFYTQQNIGLHWL